MNLVPKSTRYQKHWKSCVNPGIRFCILMVTDVVRRTAGWFSRNQALLKDLPYTPLNDHTLDATGIVSRKSSYSGRLGFWNDIYLTSDTKPVIIRI